MIIPAGFGQATLIFTGAAVPTGAVTTFGFANSGPDTAAGCAATIRDTIAAVDLLDRFSTDLTMSAVRVKLGPNATGPMAELGTADLGDSAGDSNPNTALLVSKNTAFGGRQSKGRMFFPGLIEADVAQGGAILGAARTALQTQFDDWLGLLQTSLVEMVLLHNDPLNTPDPVTSLTVSATAATQRRRLRR